MSSIDIKHTHDHVFLGSAHDDNAKRTLWVVALTVVMMVGEITAGYMDVQTQATLAADLYKTGLISLEQARIEAYRKLKHLLVISQPSQAQDAEYPRRLYNLATVSVLLILFYGLIVMGLATLREHQD